MTSSVVESKINRNSPDFDTNTRRMVDLLTEIKNQETGIQQGGGPKAIDAQHEKGRLTARERIAKLIAGLPDGHPARVEGEREIARLERLGFAGEIRGQTGPPGEHALPSLDDTAVG